MSEESRRQHVLRLQSTGCRRPQGLGSKRTQGRWLHHTEQERRHLSTAALTTALIEAGLIVTPHLANARAATEHRATISLSSCIATDGTT